ncbi:hypothetical protein Acsp03_34960 [Actinomadura sp. NBRC 104412]|uniref:hypothetical protein n=1 Tax=Actinomadura sp. NBRC 104412 TaxID=3032203 RepID=UPI0024A23EC0|nr:hypothetical protein [Actinomadura sp. NBRC 104412]GLZ06030.1 hypothetical protein Acsp03_34960 [Actinomadura sp. NBRC 104412]
MQPAPIHDGGHLPPDRTPPARLPAFRGRAGLSRPAGALLRTALRTVLIGGLALAGWLVLSALAGQQASADAHGGLGDTVRRLDGPVRDLGGIAGRALGPADPAPRPALTGVTGRTGPTERTGLTERTGSLGKDTAPVTASADRLLSALTSQEKRLLSAAGVPASPTADVAGTGVPAPDDRDTGRGTPDPRLLRPGTATTGRCDMCAGHGTPVPRPDLPTSQDDLSGVAPQAGQAPGPVAGPPPSLVHAAPAVMGVRTPPATVLKDGSSPERPTVVPD